MNRKARSWLRSVSLAVVVLAILVVAGRAAAADFRGGDTVIIEEDEVIDDDLFAAGGRIVVEGTVTGDLIAGGTDVVIDGTVEGSLFIGSNTAVINGDVGGSVYAGLYSLTLGESANIGRNVYLGGFSADLRPGSSVGRSVYTGSYQTLVAGTVADDVVADSAALVVDGEVGGDVRGEVAVAGEQPAFARFMPSFSAQVPIVPPGLEVTEAATIGGELAVVQMDEVPGATETLASRLLERLGEFIGLLLVGGVWILIAPRLLARAGNAVQGRPLPSAGWGCLITLLFPLLVVILGGVIILLIVLGGFITAGQLTGELIGIGGAGFLTFIAGFGFAFSVLTKVVIAYLLGRLILGRQATRPSGWAHFGYLVLGAFIYEVLRAVPFLGVVVAAIVILLGLGAIFLALWRRVEPGPAVEKVV